MKDITYIYYLHRGDGIPFYIGKTINPPQRKAEHKYKIKGGCKPEFVILDTVPTKEWSFWEKYWISQFKVWGFILENLNNGGGGVTFKSEQSKIKQSQSLIGHSISEETKKKMSKSALGRHHSPEQSKKLSKSLKKYYSTNPGPFSGKKHTQETRNKLSKPILAFNEDGGLVGEYPSLKEAGLCHDTPSGNIIRSMKRNGKCKGLIWKYKK